ncbi:hypothetical protein NL676_039122 [Syzygium grande]|nr:hypothetical protein NL676_039122 [Syzygium grande]
MRTPLPPQLPSRKMKFILYRQRGRDPDILPDDGVTSPRGLLNDETERVKSSESRGASARHVEVAELEMLLEAYFVQVDGTLDKLSTV